MQPLDAATIVSTWEQHAPRSGFERTLGLLRVACPALSEQERLALGVGGCHRALLSMRARTFGDTLHASLSCPSCEEDLELELSVEELCTAQPEEAAAEIEVEHEGRRFVLRPPRCEDLRDCLDAVDDGDASRRLLARCVIEGEREGLDEATVARLERAIEEAEPLADIQTRVRCSGCERELVAPLAVSAFVWRELAAEARRLIHEVHVLARAYGWRPQDVLSLSPRLRREFMELATA